MILIIGKNGSGKTYLANKLAANGYKRSVNYTTREMREGEIDGRDYVFASKEDFEKLINEGFFAEYKIRNNSYYGTPKDNLLGNTIFLSGDIEKLSALSRDKVIPFYIDCDIRERLNRVASRGTSEEEIFDRFHVENFMYLNDFEGYFINSRKRNDDSLRQIMGIVDKDGVIIEGNQPMSNREFLSIQTSEPPILLGDTSQISTFVEYEEYLLRQIALSYDLNDPDVYAEIIECYHESMRNCLKLCDINFSRDSELSSTVVLDKKRYSSVFQKEKILRRY